MGTASLAGPDRWRFHRVGTAFRTGRPPGRARRRQEDPDDPRNRNRTGSKLRLYEHGRPVGGFVNSNIKTALFWVVLIGIAVLLFAVVRTGQGRKEQALTFTEFLDKVQQGQLKEVTISGNDVHGVYQRQNLGLHTLVPTRSEET